jgi:NAD(P)-dependent dehydrogenase (short-subunit alcohol dehydrogenase family)
MSKLAGRVAVVTGGNSGIGLETAKIYAQEGATVIITARNEQRFQETLATEHTGLNVIKADVSNKADLQALFAQVNERFGKIDIVFANAGVAKFGPIDQLPDEAIDQMLDVNLKGVYYTIQAALPYLNEGASVLLNTSATNAKGEPNTAFYAATKAAVRSLARTLSAELVGRGIRVNAISPGPVGTPLYGKLGMVQEQVEGFGQYVQSKVPLGRFGTTAELAKAALFLASTDSSFVLGEELVVDGGYSLL